LAAAAVNAPALSVVIPTCGRRASLRRVLAACGEQRLAPEQFEVIVSVDGEEAEDVRGRLEARPPFTLRWTCGPHGGPSAARNRGAALARGEVLLFLDDDIVPAPDCLAQHLRVHGRANDRVGLGLVQLAAGERTPWEAYLTRRYDEHFAKLARPGYAPTFWDCLSGSLSLPRALLARSGGFDAAFMRHEDVELGYRLAHLGANFIYAPAALGEHCFTRSVASGLRDALGEGDSAARLSLRHPALRPPLLAARWQRYRGPGRALMRWALAEAGRHQRLAGRLGRLVARVEASRVPAPARRPIFQLACHLHFWLGVRGVEARLLPVGWS
jgi:glycosyltransferase involved in cell wall biosynthesis